MRGLLRGELAPGETALPVAELYRCVPAVAQRPGSRVLVDICPSLSSFVRHDFDWTASFAPQISTSS